MFKEAISNLGDKCETITTGALYADKVVITTEIKTPTENIGEDTDFVYRY